MKKLFLLLLMTAWISGLLAQNSEKRLALIIGNSDYVHGGSLKNPVNDANLMAKTLEDLGFEVDKIIDADLTQMQDAAVRFTDKISNYDVAFFYYAGHGVQVNGVNYLIPVDAQLDNILRTKYEAFDISDINHAFALNQNNLNIMVLDACRNNPFRSWMRGGSDGFSALSNQAAGTIIAFATREGETASDGAGNNGLYTEKLVEQMQRSQNITEVFQNTRVEVLKASNNKQCPQEWNMLTGNFTLVDSQEKKVPDNNENANAQTGGLITGEVVQSYGDIVINSKIAGKLYFDNTFMGNIQANSKGNILKQQKPGTHTIRLEGSNGELFTQTVDVKADKAVTVDIELNTAQNNYEQKSDVNRDTRPEGNTSVQSLSDARDGNKYKIVSIGDQVWMAENLAFDSGEGAWAFDDDLQNVENYGYLYDFETAQTVCPQGWHLPSEAEWQELLDYIAENAAPGEKRKTVKDELGKYFKSQEYWKNEPVGSNEFEFSAKPAGYRRTDNTYSGENRVAVWWSSTPAKKGRGVRFEISASHRIGLADHFQTYGFSVRCIKD